MIAYYQTQGAEFASKQLDGYKNTQLTQVWGEPDGCLFGMFGDIWEINQENYLIVYYDRDGFVEHVMVKNEK